MGSPLVVDAVVGLAGCSSRRDEDRREPPPPRPAAAVPSPGDAAEGARARVQDPGGELAQSIAIETLGGVASVVIPRGTALPVAHNETFSTASDGQPSVEISIVVGEQPRAADNRQLGKFQLRGIQPAPRGVPQIDVTFAVDADGVLEVTARDRATGAQREIRIEGAPGR